MASVLRRSLISRVRGLSATHPVCTLVRSTATLPKELKKMLDYSEMYPDMLPDPNILWRHYLRESLERQDMLNRRSVLDIPEFYVGSFMAITVSDNNAPGKKNRFVGICIERLNRGLRHQVVLRNIVENEGVELMYDLYSPMILEIEVLKLQKRLDNDLQYLRDALPEYSVVPWDMEPEQHTEGAPVPVDTTKVIMKPLPWTQKWERKELKGIIIPFDLPERSVRTAVESSKPWHKYDLMKDYREQIPVEDQVVIWDRIEEHRKTVEERHKRTRRRKFLQTKSQPQT